MTDPATIAKSLTPAQREVLIVLCDRKQQRGLSAHEIAYAAGKRPSKNYRFSMDRVARTLCDRGLAYWIRSRDDQWGIRLFYPHDNALATRALLEMEANDGR